MSTPWRVARSLVQLRAQLNAAYPSRSKASDGTIGDAAHAASVSDHNPDGAGVVRAFDVTHDPRHGVDIAQLADELRLSRDRRIKYVIANRRIFAGPAGPQPWVWRTYTGTDPHTNHVHVSVAAGTLGDDPSPWRITTAGDDEMELTKDNLDDIAEAVWAKAVARPGNTPASAGSQLGLANVNSYRALVILRSSSASPAIVLDELRDAVRKAVAEAAPEVDVDELARSIVDKLVDDHTEEAGA